MIADYYVRRLTDSRERLEAVEAEFLACRWPWKREAVRERRTAARMAHLRLDEQAREALQIMWGDPLTHDLDVASYGEERLREMDAAIERLRASP